MALHGVRSCREDDDFGVYVYDFFVRKTHWGRQIGKSLMGQKSVYY